MGIYDAMKLCRADVSTICFGLAASMGAFLLAAGSKGKRFCMPNSRVMIHQPLGGAQGSVSALLPGCLRLCSSRGMGPGCLVRWRCTYPVLCWSQDGRADSRFPLS